MKTPISRDVLVIFKLLCALAVAAMVGCAYNKNTDDLNAFISDVKSQPQGNIEPLPPVRTFDPFIYGATALRSPFDEPVVVAKIEGTRNPDVKPDPLRVKDFLESFEIDTLSMVGTLEQNGALWALVKDPDGGIHRVTMNNYLGKNHGKIVGATTAQVDLVEIVGDGLGGWVQRPRTIKLSEKE
jgi:type IV pilus assembly protein PilP